MKKLILVFGFLSSLALAHDVNLDDLMTPDEIEQEFSDQVTSITSFVETFAQPLSPQRILTPQESFEIYGVQWKKMYPLVVVINKAKQGPSAQRMIVYKNGQKSGTYVVSTGREKWETSKSGKRYFTRTPTGWFTPTRLVKNHYSRTWQAPMDYSIFFIGGIATHAAVKSSERDLGKRASGGCIRLLRSQARDLFEASQRVGQKVAPRFDRSGRPLYNSARTKVLTTKQFQTLIVVVDQPGR